MLDIVAYHEAGHAVACIALGVEIIDCWIDDSTPTPTGRVQHPNPVFQIVGERGVNEETYNAEVEAAYLKAIVILLAGEAAQRRYEPSSLGAFESALQLDRDEAHYLLTCIKGSDTEKRVVHAECENKARALTEQKWPEIEKLAAALVARRRLTGEEVIAAIA